MAKRTTSIFLTIFFLPALVVLATIPAMGAERAAGRSRFSTPLHALSAVNDREQDGLTGPVRRVKTETARIAVKNGKPVEGPRVVLETITYDNKGARVDSAYFLTAGGTLTGKEIYKYDERGNMVEMTLHDTDGSLLAKEVYSYEFDAVGNWVKMTTSVAVIEGGNLSFEPTEVTYRTIAYYLEERMVAKLSQPATPQPAATQSAATQSAATSSPTASQPAPAQPAPTTSTPSTKRETTPPPAAPQPQPSNSNSTGASSPAVESAKTSGTGEIRQQPPANGTQQAAANKPANNTETAPVKPAEMAAEKRDEKHADKSSERIADKVAEKSPDKDSPGASQVVVASLDKDAASALSQPASSQPASSQPAPSVPSSTQASQPTAQPNGEAASAPIVRGPLKPVSGGILNGKAVSLPQPLYPEMARRARVVGTVEVEVVIDVSGKVISAKAIKGPQMLMQAAEQAARQARFVPTLLSGQPVRTTGIINYAFSLQ